MTDSKNRHKPRSSPKRIHSERDLFLTNHAVNRNLYYDGNRLPYNPDLVAYARELRKCATKEERKFWKFIREIPIRAYRQRPIDHYIVDFYFPSKHIVIELDGGQHYQHPYKQYDEERTQILRSLGLTVLRFSNYEIKTNFDAVCMHVWRELGL